MLIYSASIVWHLCDIRGRSYRQVPEIYVFGDLGRDLCPRFKRKVGYSTTQSAVHVQSHFDSKHEIFFYEFLLVKIKKKNYIYCIVLYIFCVTLAMTFDLRSKGHSISTPPQCVRYSYVHFKAIGLAVFPWTRCNGKNTDFYGFTDQYTDWVEILLWAALPHINGPTLKISKLYLQNWQSYSCKCEVGRKKERKKERKKNFCNNNRTPQTEFGGVLTRYI